MQNILFTGACRSGKSNLAQTFSEHNSKKPCYLATAFLSSDAEMQERIRRHQLERGDFWQSYELFGEKKDDLPDIVKALNDLNNDLILFDSTSMWLAGLVAYDLTEVEINRHINELIDYIHKKEKKIVFVHDEVGASLVPESKMGRFFRDLNGEFGQRLAKNCETVIYSVCGLPMCLKGDMPLCFKV